jgi:tRNA (guanine37-N1)-methyltransferase
MRIDVLTLFPELFETPLRTSLLGKAIADGKLTVGVTNIRDFAADRHRTVDDEPFGGGAGMVMTCGPLVAAVESLRGRNSCAHVVLLSPRGRKLTQAVVKEFAAYEDLVLVCGRYEGVDERVAGLLHADEVSVGDYVLSGGELPALTVIEAVSRMLPGVIGNEESVSTDSFADGLLGPPQYTRPAEFAGAKVPEVLLSGHHAEIARWRRKEALRLTKARRPDLLAACTKEDEELLREIEAESVSLGQGE